MLEYDNSAFYYFTLSLISIYVLPMSVITLKQIYRTLVPPRDPKLQPRTSLEVLKIKSLRQQNHGLKTLMTSWKIWAQVVSLLVGGYILYYLLVSLSQDAEILSFNPYAILGVDVGVDSKGIKKAYRALSLQYHPDKNPGNKMAEDMFLKIAKAYEALTDPQAKENWEKYGNPDGKQSMEVSIALPTFLLEKKYHNQILILYLIAMVIVLPVIVAMWYAHSKKFGEKNVMYDTYAWYNHMLSQASRIRTMPEVMSGSAEFRQLNGSKSGGAAELQRLLKEMQEGRILPQQRYQHPILVKGTVLLFAHVMRKPIPPALKLSVDTMLIKSPDLIEALIEVACSRRWLQTTISIIDFGQCLVQGLWFTQNNLMQLPHFTDAVIKPLVLSKPPIKSIAQYIQLPDEEKKGLEGFTEAQRQDVLNACRVIPDVDIEVTAFVEDEEQIAENDLVTVKVVLTRKNVPEGKECAPVHAPRYPVPKEDTWWVLVGNVRQDQIYGFERMTDQGRTVTQEVKILAPDHPGTVQLEIFVKSECYLGLDKKATVQFEVVSQSTLPVYEPHPDDLELDDEPTLFEQVMNPEDESDSSDDEGEKKTKALEGEDGDAAQNGHADKAGDDGSSSSDDE